MYNQDINISSLKQIKENRFIEYRPGESYIDEATGKGGVSNPEVIDYEEVYRAFGPDDYVKDIEEGMSDNILTSFDNFIGFKLKKE
jgi:hypothetical protein